MSPNVTVVKPADILDNNKAVSFRRQIIEGAKQASMVLVDFSQVTFMDSSGLGALVLARKEVRNAGSQLYLCSLNHQLQMLFELTSMDQIFDIFTDQEEFKRQYLDPLG
ncbi:anti-sigma-factor antagonist [[Leptolyngbya] sp. PCC 7376]|uniref:STAS domain-containing protein n=1 Tax=[Leptolyngbya] sp. PCC 7376 TaxID=111781 RepID=UPI00029F421F|nr:STAS domain-containing protein [[Leptolyngbya] sp. PCC 7376]AFY37716.1 anti-sigma-factor antagonist [[Leptolyngbya] sp. PCC 7376]